MVILTQLQIERATRLTTLDPSHRDPVPRFQAKIRSRMHSPRPSPTHHAHVSASFNGVSDVVHTMLGRQNVEHRLTTLVLTCDARARVTVGMDA